MKIKRDALKDAGWKIKPGRLDIPFETSFTLKAEKKFSLIWPRFEHGLRWILVDLLRRYVQEVETHGDLTHAPGWARIRIVDTGGIYGSGGGDIVYRLLLPNATRKSPPYIKLSFVNNVKGFSCWPRELEPEIGEADKKVTVRQLCKAPIAINPKLAKRDISDYDVDPVAEAVVDTFPAEDKEEIIHAMIRHRMIFHTTNATGQAGATQHPVMGIEARLKNGKHLIAPIGCITEHVYFQNGWLMIKLAHLPESAQAQFTKGRASEEIISVSIPDGRGSTLRPFENLWATRSLKGKTWMGKHVQLQFEKKP